MCNNRSISSTVSIFRGFALTDLSAYPNGVVTRKRKKNPYKTTLEAKLLTFTTSSYIFGGEMSYENEKDSDYTVKNLG